MHIRAVAMKKYALSLMAAVAVCAGLADTAQLRILWGDTKKPSRTESRSIDMVHTDAADFRVTVPKGEIPSDATCVEIVPPFMKARKDNDGYWLEGRGNYGFFDKASGSVIAARQVMPIYAMKKGGTMWYAHVKTWRFNYDFVTMAKDGEYETYARFRCDEVRRFFRNYYDDIVIDFHRLDGAEADYNGVARAYRKYQLDHGAVHTIKDRLNPELDYLCDAIVVRIQTHAAKPIPDKETFYKVGEEPPIAVHMPFGVTEEFLQALKDTGIDKLSICSAGWQDGGYDGRVPGHFPVGAEAGGEEAYRRLIERAKALGFQFALHATNTDGYMCSSKWDEDWVCKFADGSFYKGGIWAGGQCYWVCQRCAWERWLPDEMRKMAALSIRGPHYIDVYSATYPIPCGDPKHLCTPERTAELQNRILAYGRELMGGAASEAGFDHVAGNIDYINYVGRDIQNLLKGKASPLIKGVFPLWELVYHGIILYNSDRATQNHTRGKCLYKLEKSGDPRWMEGDGVEDPYVALKIIEFGGRPIFYTYKFADVPRIKKAWNEFVPVRHLQRELMASHRKIVQDVFETCYADGSRTVCNYRAEPFAICGETVPAMGYLLFGPHGELRHMESFAEKMNASFDGRNALKGIRIDKTVFATGGGDLWTAEFAQDGNLTNRVKVSAHEAASFSRSYSGDGGESLVWRDIPLGGERGVLDAKVAIEKRADGSQAWRLSFDNRSQDWKLFSTDFPRLNRVMRNGEGDAMLPDCDHGARLFKKRTARPKPVRRDYLGHAPMVSAFFIGEDGLYIAAEDPEARIKSFIIEGEQNVRFETPTELGADGPRYPVVLAPLKGDWWAAARRYRDFALKQKWAVKGPIKDIQSYPRRICEIPLWINIHGGPDVASNVLAKAKALFPEWTTGLHWHLWQHSGHDVNYPEYFPEQPGVKECIAFCESIGQEPMPYTNGRLWTATTSGFLMAEPYSVKCADGARNIEKYAPWTPPMAVMCPSCPEWRRVVRNFTGRILDDLGAKSIFIDQIGAAAGCACYDPTHGHPVGGGAWWYDGYEKALEPIRRAYNTKGAFVTTEGAGEAYIGMVDGFLQVVRRTPEDVPFHNAVYSGYTTYFCSPENNDDAPAAFRALQTRELLWGNSLGWFLQDILDRPDKCGILRELCAFRQSNLDALAYGNLLDELRFAGPVGVSTYEWLGRRPHFRLFDKTFKLPPSKFATMTDVIGNWWRTADGEIVLLAANLTDKRQDIECRVFGKDKTMQLSLSPHELIRVPFR